ncbi:three-Cys-motif partner protein TcmP [uncultured Chryseobacterium sp.]|uniref:three-Cys-motif partner protein TcmP n=1 Tax=uncultured Chryseobacterium sp. TaxID=259322 RepID=UPI003749321D
MVNFDAKNELQDHSEAKVKLLGEYLKRFLNIISNDGYTEKINMYDLFCGPGLYSNGGYGSPLVTLHNVKNAYYNIINNKVNKVPKIDCYFNDIDDNKVEYLKKIIKEKKLHYPNIGNLYFTSNDYRNEVIRLKETISKYKNEKAFIFIDPCGYKELKADDIKELIGKNKKSEVLIWLPIQFMYRFSGEATPDVLKNFILNLNIKNEVQKSENVWDFIYALKKGFQNHLGDNYFVDNFSLKKEENTVFCLYFFTSHIKGYEKMLESKWEIDTEEGRGWNYKGNTPTLFFEQKTNKLEDLLMIFIKSGKRSNYDVYEFTLRAGFLTKHATEVLSNLQKTSKLDVFLFASNEKARKNSFYVKYYRPNDNEKNKVYFVIK